MSLSLCWWLCVAVVLVGLPAPGWAAPDDPSERVDALIRKYVRDDGPGMAVLVIKDGKVVCKKGYGLANLAKKIPIAPDTNFELASVSKQFTAMAIMILNDQKKLSFDDYVRKHLPALPAYDPKRRIRIRDLLTHMSGLPKDYPYDLAGSQDVFQWFLKAKKPLAYPTGTKHRYSNLGYVILALVVEAAGAKSYNTFLQEEVFEPLGMKRSVAFESPKVNRKRYALGYKLLPTIKQFKEDDPPESVRKRTKAENFQVEQADCCVVGDGSIWSNLDDLARWDEAVRNGQLVKAETWTEALTPPRRPNGKKVDYGFGWGLTTDRNRQVIEVWHEGGFGGFSALNRVDFREKLCVAILCNIDGFEYLSAIADGIRDIYLGKKKAKK
jgi:CubicO group peptidase (beta-lactamase class C family)